MEPVLMVVGLVFILLPPAVALVPPIVMAGRRRWPLPAVALWLLAIGLLVAWSAAASADIDRADATGGEGSIWAGAPWLFAAAVAGGAAVRTVTRPGGPAVIGR
jgi:hypothetical protein